MENPFSYGIIVKGDYFTDRENELAELKLDMRSGQNVVIISPRRFGKTSLVVQAIEDLAREGVLVAYVDLMISQTKAEFVTSLANALYEGLVAPFDRALKKAQDFFAHLRINPKFTFDPISGAPSIELTPVASERDVDRILLDLLAFPAKAAHDRDRRVVVVMDEFQEILGFDPHLPAKMRAIFQQQSEVSHVFLGSRRHIMTEVFTGSNQPMFRMAKALPLGVIARPVFAEFLRERFTATRMRVLDGSIDRILDITGCHLHDTQQLAYFVWSHAYLRNLAVTPDLVDQAFGRVLEVEDARFSVLWDDLPRSQRLLLKALAADPSTSIYSEEYRLRHGLGAPTTVQGAVAALQKKDLIELTRAGHRVPDLVFAAWIRRYRTAPEQSVRIARRTPDESSE